MRIRWCAIVLGAGWLVASGCANPFGRQYEYEEQYYLSTTGATTVVVDASVPALVALRGLSFDPSPSAFIDRATVRKRFEDAGCRVVRVAEPWFRSGRRFVQVTIQADDVRDLASCAPLAWSRFSGLVPENDAALGPIMHYRQLVGAAAAGNPGAVKWTGNEVVAVKLHLPSRVLYQNARSLADGGPRDLERGNIVTWEQRLSDRLASKPIDIDVKMNPESILYTTLWLFAGAFGAAVLVMASVIWWIVKKGRTDLRRTAAGRG